MRVEIKAQEDENFKFIFENEMEQVEDSHTESVIPTKSLETNQPEPPKRREPTLENPKGHEWFNGTSWGLK